jgi:hypothetical protein
MNQLEEFGEVNLTGGVSVHLRKEAGETETERERDRDGGRQRERQRETERERREKNE